MVQADIQRSTQGVASAFEDRDIQTIAVTGGLAAVGFAVALTVGGTLASFTPGGLMPFGRLEAVVVGLGAMLAAMGGLSVLPSYLGGPLAVGAIVAVGMAFLSAIIGAHDEFDEGRIRGIMNSADFSNSKMFSRALRSSATTGCSTCGTSGGGSNVQRVRTVAQGSSNGHFR